MTLLIRGGTLITMNDAFDIIEGDVSGEGRTHRGHRFLDLRLDESLALRQRWLRLGR